MTGHFCPNNCVDGFCAANFTSPYRHSSSELGSENISIHSVWTAYGDEMRKRERDLMLMLLTDFVVGVKPAFPRHLIVHIAVHLGSGLLENLDGICCIRTVLSTVKRKRI